MAPVKPKSPKTPGRSLNDFQATHDKNVVVPTLIREALSRIVGEWRYEMEFIREANISIVDIGRYRDNFSEHMVVIKTKDNKPKNVWFGSTADADKARDMEGVS